ncbi:hypothetical protein CDL12_11621 [Handroanthus impetiginosus]|uniref:DUF1685 domain-containing protein n=1 Tax=Handroanthus impetiginosus TaxID=429701 RepID=A0A2G9HDX5_9LAMI|nr:hypothetical protein CDL12_11621 [Handroanthus impetiginosus]
MDHQSSEPGELLEKSWFFGNRKTRMSRSFSDPCSSSSYGRETLPGKSYEETYESIKKLSGQNNLIRAPSLPPCLEKKDQKTSDSARRKSNRKSKNLLRAPSLPANLEAEEFQDEEMEFSMGKLIRQASLSNSDTIPARTPAAKDVSASSNLSRDRSRMRLELESLKLEKIKPQNLRNRLKPQKSLNDLELEELQGFKDLGFDFDKKDLNPNVISLIPGLQEKNKMEEDEEKNRRRPYLSEAWSSAPPVPRWGVKRSTDDIKAQIKFWARAVASNVRQEC